MEVKKPVDRDPGHVPMGRGVRSQVKFINESDSYIILTFDLL